MPSPFPSDSEPYEIKKQSRFNITLSMLFPNDEVMVQVERSIKYAVQYFPQAGIDTGRSSPTTVYAWPIMRTERHPAVVVYYCVIPKRTVLLLDVRIADSED